MSPRAGRARAARRRRRHAPVRGVERHRRLVRIRAIATSASRCASWRAASRPSRRTSTSACATPGAAVRLLNRLRAHLPLLLALSANSPFWQGRATGFASTRTTLFDAFPRSGVPRGFRGYADWVATVDPLLRSGAIADPSFLWWDVRLQPRYGTVEVRIMDGQTTVEDVAALAALVQSLARLELARPERPGRSCRPLELIEENRFLAARDGMRRAADRRRLRRAHPGDRASSSGPLAACRRHAERLGCARELAAAAARRVAGTGAARQLAHARDGDLRRVTAPLASAYFKACRAGARPAVQPA